ncbi:MAG: hypothetical protein ACRENK_09360 [Gemmatimonadaceae bacterium]
MRTQAFLTSMTPDGKPGQLVEAQLDDSQQQFITPDGKLVAAQSSAPVQFAEPVPYNTLSDEEVAALGRERKALMDSLDRLDPAERAKAEKRVRQIDVDLKRQRMIDEASRRHQERSEERKTQASGGDSGTGGRATHQVTKPTLFGVREVNWPAFVASVVATKAANRTPKVCCSGPNQYWCSKCRAKAGV